MNIKYKETSKIHDLYPFDFFNKDVLKEVGELFRVANENKHVAFFFENLRKSGDSPATIDACARYGLSLMTDTEDFALADLFFLLAGLKKVKAPAYDFFMDAMIYCEDQYIGYKNADEFREKYRTEIRPSILEGRTP